MQPAIHHSSTDPIPSPALASEVRIVEDSYRGFVWTPVLEPLLPRIVLQAEILLRHTVFRLSEMLHDTGYQDRKVVAKTLQSVSQADNDAMLQVFKK